MPNDWLKHPELPEGLLKGIFKAKLGGRGEIGNEPVYNSLVG